MKVYLSSAGVVLFVAIYLSGCSVLTLYHDRSYVPVLQVTNNAQAGLEPPSGEASHEFVTNMNEMDAAAQRLYDRGFAMLGYSKFISPLAPVFAKSRAVMKAEDLGASAVLQIDPEYSPPNNYIYVVTYWGKVKEFTFGAYFNEIPEEALVFFPQDLVQFLGPENQPMFVEGVVEGSPAAKAGIKRGELIAGVNGRPFLDKRALFGVLRANAGQEVSLQLWGRNGPRTVQVTLNPVIYEKGTLVRETMFSRQPWLLTNFTDWSALGHAVAQNARNLQTQMRQQAEQQRIANLEAQVGRQQQLLNLNARKDEVISGRGGRKYKWDDNGKLVEITQYGGGRGGSPITGKLTGGFGNPDYGKITADLATDWYFTHSQMWGVSSSSMGCRALAPC